MKIKTIRLEAGDVDYIRGNPEKSIIGDVRKLLGRWNQALRQWNGEHRIIRLHPDGTPVDMVEIEGELVPAEHVHTSGYRIEIFPLPFEVLEEAVVNEDGNVITPAVLSNVHRYDIRMPEFLELNNIDTRKEGRNPQRRYGEL